MLDYTACAQWILVTKIQLLRGGGAFNPSTWEGEAGGSLTLSPDCSIEQVPGQPGVHRETLVLPTPTKNKLLGKMDYG